jgi:hypothetical protein
MASYGSLFSLALVALIPSPSKVKRMEKPYKRGVKEVEAQYYCGRDLIARKC